MKMNMAEMLDRGYCRSAQAFKSSIFFGGVKRRESRRSKL
jgi:hypothetical protein